MITPMLYTLRMMSTHHPTCPQLSGMACGALRDRGEALLLYNNSGPERVKGILVFPATVYKKRSSDFAFPLLCI